MAESMHNSNRSQVDEKAATQPQDDSDLERRFGHLEVTDMSVSPNIPGSEKDVTVRVALLGAGAHRTDWLTLSNKMTFRRFMGFTAMAFLWTGSQIPVYLFGTAGNPSVYGVLTLTISIGGIPPYIYRSIGGSDRWIWFVLANLLGLAGVCPFVGSLSDLIGRRYVAICGVSLICIGMIVSSTANTMNIFIGAGAGVNELTALAATSEMAPTRKRGIYVSVLIFTIVPFGPSVLWAQLIAYHSSWRYVGALCGAWNGFGLLITLLFYFPPPRANSVGLSKAEILSRVDYVGGLLSILGLIVFMAGMQWGGYMVGTDANSRISSTNTPMQYPWTSAHVLAPLIIGFLLLVAFAFWEIYGAKYPIFPTRLKQEPRTLGLTLVITFISGANFFSVLMFWPTESFNVYGHDPMDVGIRSLPVGFGILAGACIILTLLSVFRGHNKELLIVSSVCMTAGCGALAIGRTDNLYQLWGILVLACLGIGGIVVPASIITTIICPDDLIATISALTLSIRVVGGSIGYCIYYNVFISKFVPAAQHYIGGAMAELNITNIEYITDAIELTSASLLDEIRQIPGIVGNEMAYQVVVGAGQLAYAESYKWVYYSSIAFGGVSILAACFLGSIDKYMTDHVAVVM